MKGDFDEDEDDPEEILERELDDSGEDSPAGGDPDDDDAPEADDVDGL